MEHNKDNNEKKAKIKLEPRIKSVLSRHIIWTLHYGHCPTDYVPGWQDNYVFEASNEDLAVDIELWTVGGSDEYDRASFNDITTKISQHCPKVPFALVGCKTDLRDDHPDPEALRTGQIIRHEEGEELAKQIGAVKYFECSSLKNRGLKEMMQEVAKIVLLMREKNPSEKKKDKERCIVQ